MKKFSEDHEWVELTGDVAVIGITSYAADELGDLTFVELPEVDQEVCCDDPLCVVESVKAASDVVSPVDGIVTEVNLALEEEPGLINASAEDKGWLCKVKGVTEKNLVDLMSESEYEEFISAMK